MKKTIRFFSIFLIVRFFSIFLPVQAQEKEPFSTLIKGSFTVGTYFTNPPFEFMEQGKKVGFEIDLIEAICKRLHLKCVFVDTVWEGILNRLENNQYDAVVGGITITKEREKTLNFSIPYMVTTLSVVINEKLTPAIKSISDLKGKTVGVQAQTTDQDVALKMLQENKIGKIMIYPFADLNAALQDLEKGTIQAIFKVFPVAFYLSKHNPNMKIAAQIPNDPQPLGIGFNKQNPDLLKAFNQALKEMQRDGTYKTIYNKWFES